MPDRATTEHVILRSTMHVRLEFSAEEYRLDFRASYPRGATLPVDQLLARVAALCGEQDAADKRHLDCDDICEELVDLAEGGGDLSCHCECDTDSGGRQFMLLCHAID